MQTKHLDHLGIVAGICDHIELVQQIDAFFPNQARKVSVGEATKAMILNALGFVSRPLYLSSEFLRNKAVDLLFRPNLLAEDFNDDSLGRALDALFEKDVTTVFAQVASHALHRAGIEHRWFVIESKKASIREQESAKKKVAASQDKEKKNLQRSSEKNSTVGKMQNCFCAKQRKNGSIRAC